MWKKSRRWRKVSACTQSLQATLPADTQSLLTCLETDYVYIPAGCTGIAQLMDVSFNDSLKRKNLD